MRLPETSSDFDSSRTVKRNLLKLNVMRAIKQIDEDEARDLEHYFHSAL